MSWGVSISTEVSSLAQIEEVKALVVQLRGGTDEEKGMAALGVYNMTSFASAVSIDDPKALTSYDKKVFGHEAEGASEDGEWKAGEPVPDSETPPESKSGDDELGEVRLRNHVWQVLASNWCNCVGGCRQSMWTGSGT